MEKRILVVEDTVDLSRVVAMRLRSSGYDVEVAFDAIQAVERAVNSHPHLILLDLGLPGGDGLDVLKRVRSMVSTAHIPVVVFTAKGKGFIAKAMEMGAAACLSKPCPSSLLLETIKSALLGNTSVKVEDEFLG